MLFRSIVIISKSEGEDILYSLSLGCTECGFSFGEISPRLFSFNSPYGACPSCGGLGSNLDVDPALVIPDMRKPLSDGAILPWASSSSNYYPQLYQALQENFGIDVDKPLDELSESQLETLLYGNTKQKITLTYDNGNGRSHTYQTLFKGVIPIIERNHKETTSDYIREDLENYMSARACPDCGGARLKPEALAVRLGGLHISQVTQLTVRESLDFFLKLELSEKDQIIAKQVLKEITERLGFLINVGLDYLSLARKAGTLSGGEEIGRASCRERV